MAYKMNVSVLLHGKELSGWLSAYRKNIIAKINIIVANILDAFFVIYMPFLMIIIL
jgi:hypothetical protein